MSSWLAEIEERLDWCEEQISRVEKLLDRLKNLRERWEIICESPKLSIDDLENDIRKNLSLGISPTPSRVSIKEMK